MNNRLIRQSCQDPLLWELPPAFRQYQIFISLAVSLIIAGYLFGGNFWAKWGITDDHEVMYFIGYGERLSVTDFFPTLMRTEAGQFGLSQRYRPSYYFLRLLECIVWGKDPFLWYVFRFGVFAFFLFVVWYVMSPHVGFLVAGLLTMLIAFQKFWAGIFARLGPAEIYGSLGIALFIVGVDRSLRRESRIDGPLLLFLGTVIAAGSKENFIFLLIPLLFFLVVSIVRKLSWTIWLFVLLSILFCIMIGVAAWMGNENQGVDIYQNSTQLSDRLAVLLRILTGQVVVWQIVLNLFFFVGWFFLRGSYKNVGKSALIVLLWLVVIVAVYVSQAVFYNGVWPTGRRHDFPGALYLPVIIAVLAWFIRSIFHHVPEVAHYRVWCGIGFIVGLFLMVSLQWSDVMFIRYAVQRNVEHTMMFSNKITRLIRVANDNPNHLLILQSNNTADYEPLASYRRFLISNGVENPFVLLWNSDADSQSGLSAVLSKALTSMSINGVKGDLLPFSESESYGNKCILLVLSGAPGLPCEFNIDARWQ